ncbi:MAG: hypothetical protein JXQ91_07710 [Vannielia sp.]|uniref:hypothetical protein n=1 Tax=Vannielia sp. TaxID=2813045 RepID=UPI003B8C3E46
MTKFVTIRPVAEPKSFNEVRFSQNEYKAAVATGEKRVPFGTAMRNIKLSKGLYEIKPEVKTVHIEPVGPKAPEEMTNEELALEMHGWGKPIKKTGKQVTRGSIIKAVKELRQHAAEMIVDGDPEDD